MAGGEKRELKFVLWKFVLYFIQRQHGIQYAVFMRSVIKNVKHKFELRLINCMIGKQKARTSCLWSS